MRILEHPLIVPCVRRAPLALGLAALAAMPQIIHDAYVLRILVLVGIYVLLTSSLNLVNGYTGLFSLGHAAFYGVGAYTSAILVMRTGWSVWVGMIAGALGAAVVAWLIAKPTMKLKGVYLTLTTLGLNIIIMLVFLNWVDLTKGPLGIAGIPVPTLFGRRLSAPADYYYLILVVDVLVVFALSRLVNSRFGRALKAIREDERAAHACGIPLIHFKTVAFVLSAALAGLAGSFYAHYMRYISPEAFSYPETFNIVTILAFGGPGNLIGPIVGSVILISATEAFRVFAAYRMIIFGTVLVGTMLLRREGLLGGREYSFLITWPPRKKVDYGKGDRFLDAAQPPERGA
ncbi:MAG: branched-chain amino acid ABC transporter permease [Ancalomicrobiaceae bacterium]|nr:branched-chain amino acid ABC transporter permease [Ancalomicrobiaceae bacterium]